MDHSTQHGPSSQETPRRTPQTTSPPKDSLREVGLVAALLLGLVVAIGGIWMYQEQAGTAPTAKRSAGNNRIAREAKTVTAPTRALKEASARAVPAAAGTGAARPSPSPSSGNFDVYFNVGQDSLTSKAKSLLAEQAPRLAGHKKVAVFLHGHTDRRGSAASNEALGRKRARAVEAELVKLGVPKTAIQVFSRGEHGALCGTKTEACHRKNRRVHVSWNATSDLTSASAGAEPSAGPVRGENRMASDDQTPTNVSERAPVRAAQAATE